MVKPLFSDKFLSNESTTLVEASKIFQNDTKVSETFNDFSSNAVKHLNIIVKSEFSQNNIIATTDPVKNAVLRYEDHPSNSKIKDIAEDANYFCFKHVSMFDIETEILLLNVSKACPKGSIPPNIINNNSDIIARRLLSDFNKSIDSASFPVNLKNADITPAHKKGDRTGKSNYRPVSILPAMSKIYEKLLYCQISTHMETKVADNLCGFREGHSAQHWRIVLLEKWRATLDKKGFSGVLLTDLSKAFDSLSHDLLLAKLYAYGFDYNSVKLIHDYLVNRHQRVLEGDCKWGTPGFHFRNSPF